MSIVDGSGNASILGAYRDSYNVSAGGKKVIEFALFADGTGVRRNAEGQLVFFKMTSDEARLMYLRACAAVVFVGETRAGFPPDSGFTVLYINNVAGPARQLSLRSCHEGLAEGVVATQNGLEAAVGELEQEEKRKAWTPDYRRFREAWANLRAVLAADVPSAEQITEFPLRLEDRSK